LRDAFIARLGILAESDPKIFLITADLGFGVLDKFGAKFSRQFLNIGVAEQNMTGVATGLAMEGRIVYTYSIGNFPTLRCLEQIRNDAAYHEANVKVVAIGGGFSYGPLGFSHHATEDISIMRALPNVTVVAPGDIWEASEATEAIAARPGVCYLRLDKSAAPPAADNRDRFVLGKARLLRQGSDVTIASTGGILGEVLRAADALNAAGVSTRILSVHTVSPLDSDAVFAACRETGGLITVEEHTVAGGFGSAVSEVCLEGDVRPRAFKRVGLRAGFSSHVGSQDFLRERYDVSASAIYRAACGIAGLDPSVPNSLRQ
jgi:transketolase